MAEYINGSTDILGGSVIRHALNTTTPNQAVIRKIIAGNGISISSTGVDAGTGDVIISIDVSGTGGSGGGSGTPTSVGTVTSVNMVVPAGLTVTGGPVTTAGSLILQLSSGYTIPLIADIQKGISAYNDRIISLSYNTTTGYITLTQLDGGSMIAPITLTPFTTSDLSEGTNLYYTNTRARLALSFVAGSGAYNSATGLITIPTNTNQLTNGAGFITGNQNITLSGDVSGSGTTAITTTLATITQSTGSSFVKISLDTKGRVIGNSNVLSADIITALGYTPYNVTNPAGYQVTSEKGVANGYASLNSSGQVPSTQLPSYVDDVLEYANLAAFPATGESGKIYVTADTNKTYRWTGTVYVEISASPGSTDAVTEGTTNLYFTNARARAAISLTTTGTSGAATYNSTTGVLNVPQYGDLSGSGTATQVAFFTGTKVISSDSGLYWDNTNKRLGISTSTPYSSLQIGSTSGAKYLGIVDTADTNYNIAYVGHNADKLHIGFSNSNTSISERNAISINSSDLYVGIGVSAPVNRLQVGSMGSTGFSGNHLAFGNGAAATAFFQGSSYTIMYLSTYLSILPSGSGTGNMVVGALNSTGYRLEVVGTMRVTSTLTLESVAAATVNTDKYLVSDGNIVKYRTAAQILSDIGGQASGSYVPTSRTLTINGTAFDLTANRTWSVGTVTSVSGDGTVSGLTLTGTVTGSGSLTLGGTLSLTSLNVTNALGYTPYNSTNPNSYISAAQTYYIGTTLNALNRASASQTLTGVSIDGNAATSSALSGGGTVTTAPSTNQLFYTGQISTGASGLFTAVDNSNSIITLNRHPGNYDSQLGFSSNGNLYYRSFSATAINTTQAWQTIWTSSNDGAGSGLDADLLDGYSTATTATANTIALRDGSGHITANYLFGSYVNTTDSDESSITRFIVKNGDNYHRSATTTTAANIIRGVASGDWAINVFGYSGKVLSTSVTNVNTQRTAGYLEYYDVADATGAPGSSWFSYISVRHGNPSNQYGFQFANGFGNETLYWRGWDGSSPLSWRTVLHSGNVGSYAITSLSGETLQQVMTRGASSSTYMTLTGGGMFSGNEYTFRSNVGSGVYLGGGTTTVRLQAYSDDGGAAFMSFHRSNSYAVHMGLDPDNVFRIGGFSAAANRLQLNMSGDLSVGGSLTSNTNLNVGTDIYLTQLTSPYTSTIRFGDNSGWVFRLQTSVSSTWTTRFSFTDGGTFTAVGDVIAYSDARVKTNVVTIKDSLEKVQKLRGVTYNRTDSTDDSEKIGVIAQEIQKVLPQVVTEDKDGMLGVSYGNLAGVFIEAIKEQQTQIEDLKKQIQYLVENR